MARRTRVGDRAIGLKYSQRRASMPATEHHDPRASGGDNARLPTLAETEMDLLTKVMSRASGIKSRAARMLGIDVRRLNRMLKRLGLDNKGE